MKYGLIGGKLGHSFSKLIHEQIEDYTYELHPLPTEAEAHAFMQAADFAAINVTIPYKKLVIPYCAWVEPQAAAIGAVNCVVKRGGRLYGYNTDAAGFEYLLHAHDIAVQGRTVLLLGSGGTHNTAAAVCQKLGAKKIITVSRSGGGDNITYEQAAACTEAQLVVNTSPAGMYPNNGTCLLDLHGLSNLEAVVDVVYNPFKTELLLRAEEQGVKAVCGLEMLVAQAVYAAAWFTDAPPKTEAIAAVSAGLRRQLANVSLIGMPGCGKTSVAKGLAEALGKTCVDLDAEIERAAGCTIPQIFEREGEAGFRAREAEITRTFGAKNGCVLSCGGGVVKSPGNVRALRQNGPVLFIDRPVELLAMEGRPLSTGLDRLRQMEQERRPLYEAAADAAINNDQTLAKAIEGAGAAFEKTYNV